MSKKLDFIFSLLFVIAIYGTAICILYVRTHPGGN